MNKAVKIAVVTLCAATVATTVPALAACGTSSQTFVTSVTKTGTDNTGDIYTVYYSDGSTSSFTIPTTSDTLAADGLYEKYKEETGEDISYEEFLEKYMAVNADTTATVTNYCLQSTLKIYSQFVETTYSFGGGWHVQTMSDYAIYTGAAIIYQMDESADGYSYLVTNYHVVFDNNADVSKNGGSKIALELNGYLYGSESSPIATEEKDANGYTEYDYGEYAIPLEYVGGSITNDIAVLRAKTSDIKAVNENACEVKIADEYYVGETAIAIGNPEDGGISVTRGVISTVNEQIALAIDDTTRAYRSMRIDTALYSGNSGGGLFNCDGELIGITNAGNGDDQNINYAVPLEIVTGVANNIIYYANDGDDSTNDGYDITFGFSVETTNSKYVYDQSVGYGEVFEDVNVSEVNEGSIAEKMGLQQGDIVKSLIINGKEIEIDRSYDISDLAFTVRPGDTVNFKVERAGESITLTEQTIAFSDLTAIDG